MKEKQNLIRTKHQNLNKLFYDIGWRVKIFQFLSTSVWKEDLCEMAGLLTNTN